MTLFQRSTNNATNNRNSPVTPEKPHQSFPFHLTAVVRLPSLSEHDTTNGNYGNGNAYKLNSKNSKTNVAPATTTRGNTSTILAPNDRKSVVMVSMWTFFVFWICWLGGLNFLGEDHNHPPILDHDNVATKFGHTLQVMQSGKKVSQASSYAIFFRELDDTQVNNDKNNNNDNGNERYNDIPTIQLQLDKPGPFAISVRDVSPNNKITSKRQSTTSTMCPLTVQLVGETILFLQFTQNGNEWTAQVEFPPLDGFYTLHSQMATTVCEGCTVVPSYAVTVEVKGSDKWASSLVPLLRKPKEETSSLSSSTTIFPNDNHLWIRAKHIQGSSSSQESSLDSSYVWANPQTQLSTSKSSVQNQKWISATTRGILPQDDVVPSLVSLASTIVTPTQQSWFDAFRDLSNYELVCWIGGSAAQLSMAVFLSLRADLFPSQRPFKFHHYHMTSLHHPDAHWNEEERTKFRKCKHVLVVLDDDDLFLLDASAVSASTTEQSSSTATTTGATSNNAQMATDNNDHTISTMSAKNYRTTVVRFLQHLTRAFPDATFPIWVFTIALETPTRARERRHCHPDDKDPDVDDDRSNIHHPCNVVLFDIFDHKTTLFDAKDRDRIRLLNNTDLSMTMIASLADALTQQQEQSQEPASSHPRPPPRILDVLAVIALRIYVMVGKQVQEWRSKGQIGKIDGLHRNGTVEPNFELVPYAWK